MKVDLRLSKIIRTLNECGFTSDYIYEYPSLFLIYIYLHCCLTLLNILFTADLCDFYWQELISIDFTLG
jgi:hypothetical protein